MEFKDVAINLLPSWFMGLSIIGITYLSSCKEALRVHTETVKKWTTMLLVVAAMRSLSYLINPEFCFERAQIIAQIPWQATPFVFWEDACHGLLLYLVSKTFKEGSKLGSLVWAITCGLLMAEFGLGHMYQGIPSALLLSLYVPISYRLGKKYGFGTVMICHVLFDLITIIHAKGMVAHHG